jgi:ABC-type sugar transport system substrate-binding protein
MKKILALVLALMMVFTLAACGGEGTSTTPTSQPTAAPAQPGGSDTQPAATGKAYPNCNPDGSINLDTIAHYDAEYDYTKNPKFKVAYLVQQSGPLYQQSADAYEHWAPLFNMEWAGFISANGDSDMFLTNLQTAIDQGVRGFILDPDGTLFPSVLAKLSQYPDVFWMSQMSPPRDGEAGDGIPLGGNMINNYVGFDNVEAGRQVTRRLVQWKNETYPDVPWSEVGFLMMDYTVSPPLDERRIGSLEVFLEAGGLEENFFVADTVSTGMTMQGGKDAAGPIVSSNSKIKYWLCNGLFDDMAQAAASIFDQQGLTDTSCVCVFGGSALQMQWDAGQQDAFRYAVFTAQNLYAEPIIGAVYAFLNGWATPDNIWPSWVKWDDHGTDGHTYSQLRLPTEPLEYETYKHYLEWTDMYAHAEAYPYSQDGISLDDYSPFVKEVPADYKQP